MLKITFEGEIMIYKKILVTLLMSTFILSAQAMNNEKDDDFFEKYTLDRSEKIVLKKNYKEEKDDEDIDYFNVENLNNSKGSNSGSNFSDDFKELIKFHDYIGNINHLSSNWDKEKEDLKEKYLDTVSLYVSRLLSEDNSFLCKSLNINHSLKTAQDFLKEIHLLGIPGTNRQFFRGYERLIILRETQGSITQCIQ